MTTYGWHTPRYNHTTATKQVNVFHVDKDAPEGGRVPGWYAIAKDGTVFGPSDSAAQAIQLCTAYTYRGKK